MIAERTAAALRRWTDGGALPVVVDASSCTHGLIADAAAEEVQVLDSIEWLHDHLLARLTVRHRVGSAVVHPTCSVRHLGLGDKLLALAQALADEVTVPASTGCCGMAGDRGWLHPELPASALRDLTRELDGRHFDAALSSNRTCEVALGSTGQPYASVVQKLEELTRE